MNYFISFITFPYFIIFILFRLVLQFTASGKDMESNLYVCLPTWYDSGKVSNLYYAHFYALMNSF